LDFNKNMHVHFCNPGFWLTTKVKARQRGNGSRKKLKQKKASNIEGVK
jgi:hypothetical protein